MLQGEHSAILSTFIKLPFVIKLFVLSIFEWLLKTGLLHIKVVNKVLLLYRDGVIKLWAPVDTTDSKGREEAPMTCVFTMKAHQKAVTCGCWSGTTVIATGSDDQTIVFWYVHQKPAIQKSGMIYR